MILGKHQIWWSRCVKPRFKNSPILAATVLNGFRNQHLTIQKHVCLNCRHGLQRFWNSSALVTEIAQPFNNVPWPWHSVADIPLHYRPKKKEKHFRNNQHRHSTGKFGHFPFFFETNPDVLDTQHPLVNHHFPIGFLGVSMSIPIAGWFMENPMGKALWSMIFPYCSMVFPYLSW